MHPFQVRGRNLIERLAAVLSKGQCANGDARRRKRQERLDAVLAAELAVAAQQHPQHRGGHARIVERPMRVAVAVGDAFKCVAEQLVRVAVEFGEAVARQSQRAQRRLELEHRQEPYIEREIVAGHHCAGAQRFDDRGDVFEPGLAGDVAIREMMNRRGPWRDRPARIDERTEALRLPAAADDDACHFDDAIESRIDAGRLDIDDGKGRFIERRVPHADQGKPSACHMAGTAACQDTQ